MGNMSIHIYIYIGGCVGSWGIVNMGFEERHMIAYAYTFRRIRPYSRGVFHGRAYGVYTIRNGIITENARVKQRIKTGRIYGQRTRESRMTAEYREKLRLRYRRTYDSNWRKAVYARDKKRTEDAETTHCLNVLKSLITEINAMDDIHTTA